MVKEKIQIDMQNSHKDNNFIIRIISKGWLRLTLMSEHNSVKGSEKGLIMLEGRKKLYHIESYLVS